MVYDYEIKSLLFGLAIGDVLGVPVELASREHLNETPVFDMEGYTIHNKPPGTFSDDSSLTFALVESLIDGYNLNTIALNMIKWYDEGFWTGDGEAFGIGKTTHTAINNLRKGVNPNLSGESYEYSNGNGPMMRIAPILFIITFKPICERFQIIKEVSSITHAHTRSIMACFYFLEFLRHLLLNDLDKYEIYSRLQKDIPEFLNKYLNGKNSEFDLKQITYFNRLFIDKIYEFKDTEINSGLYIVDIIEASIWCLLTTNNYKEAVLKAVNLGGDTDTTASVTGALAGLLYGFDEIPKEWIDKLVRNKDIEDLAIRFSNSLVV
ncbi:ADP-ribosyl-[dinitrogen reductase] glycohydrolase [Methanobrevibacter cuticularis]|uniref:ADP-ribosyl-[dinitrogen reductase] glycohydrolase n=1 Tax=Methanobrevibacter cuticularis TaxID=47311 RepID=A0A166D585_9EURY|nr:ADP-ribosylglycohydrolase family protein [Methanobrevibacter cuticularis]KZX15220.1 ADP-ribosyl-[dinitrogen reductase] glycohydrolase [Methanobrevibacter cuticularis]